MKILSISTVDVMGGAAKISWEINKTIEAKGFDVNHLVRTKTLLDKKIVTFQEPSFLNTIIKKLTKRNIGQLYNSLRAYLFSNDINIGSVESIVNHPLVQEADIIHCHNLHGDYFNLEALVEISKKIPIVWTLHDMWSFTGHCAHSYSCNRWQEGCGNCPNLSTYRAQAWDNTANIFKKKEAIYQRSKLNIVAPSQWLYKKLDKSILRNQPKNLIYNGVNINVFKPVDANKARLKLGLPQNKKIVLFVAYGGKKNPFKGGMFFDNLAKTYRTNSDTLFICIGGRDKPSSDETNIIYLPHIKDTKEMALYFSASDIFLFTSLAENCPIVVLEALSAGIPILSFDVGGVKEIVEHKKNGYIVKYKDKKDLIKGFEWVLNLDLKKIKNIKKLNREKAVKYFSLKIMVDEYLKLYKQLLK